MMMDDNDIYIDDTRKPQEGHCHGIGKANLFSAPKEYTLKSATILSASLSVLGASFIILGKRFDFAICLYIAMQKVMIIVPSFIPI